MVPRDFSPLFDWLLATRRSPAKAPDLAHALSVEALPVEDCPSGLCELLRHFRRLGHLPRLRKAEAYLRRREQS